MNWQIKSAEHIKPLNWTQVEQRINILEYLLITDEFTQNTIEKKRLEGMKICLRALGENGYMYMNGWVPLLSTWNYENIVNQLYTNIK